MDDAHLDALVEYPPIPHTSLLASLVSLRFTTWIQHACAIAVRCCSAQPMLHGKPSATLLNGIAHERIRYELRARSVVRELSRLLEIDERSQGLECDLDRWQWVLHDYAHALDARLGEVLEVLGARYHGDEATSLDGAWASLCRLQKVDACTGLALSHAAAASPRSASNVQLGFGDPHATRAQGSPAWWCQWLVAAWDYDDGVGEHVPPQQLQSFVDFGWQTLDELEPELASALRRIHPS